MLTLHFHILSFFYKLCTPIPLKSNTLKKTVFRKINYIYWNIQSRNLVTFGYLYPISLHFYFSHLLCFTLLNKTVKLFFNTNSQWIGVRVNFSLLWHSLVLNQLLQSPNNVLLCYVGVRKLQKITSESTFGLP